MWAARRSIAIRRIGDGRRVCSPDGALATSGNGGANLLGHSRSSLRSIRATRRLRSRALRSHAALVDIFLAVNRPDVRGISVKIWPSDPVLRAVLVDPLPQEIGRDPAFGAGLALGAHDVSRKPVSIAAAPAAAMV